MFSFRCSGIRASARTGSWRRALRCSTARAQVEEQRRAQLAETRALLREWITLRERLGRYDSALLPLARQRSDAALTTYRAGSGILIVALDARRAMLDTEMERLKLALNAARVWAQLNTLVGLPAQSMGNSTSASAVEQRP